VNEIYSNVDGLFTVNYYTCETIAFNAAEDIGTMSFRLSDTYDSAEYTHCWDLFTIDQTSNSRCILAYSMTIVKDSDASSIEWSTSTKFSYDEQAPQGCFVIHSG
jgi:hypothetical protein